MALYNDYSGQEVTLSTVDDQVFKGTLCSLDEETGKIVMKNASTNGSKLPGLQNFFASGIKNLSLTKQLQASRVSDNPRKDGRKHITPLLQERYHRKSHLKKLLRFDSDQLVRSHCMGAESGDQGIGSGEDIDTFNDFYEEENYTVFCQLCDEFRQSIVCLMRQNVIAVTFFGSDIGRKGTLTLIQIATKTDIFLYDILRLGTEGFVDGLQAVLESNDVLKVIHDCRLISDLLCHQYQVSLNNVFDTQVASAFVFRSTNDGNWPRFVESLPGVLMTHLRLKNEDVNHFFVRERLRQRDEEVWLQRPLCIQLVKDSLKNLIYMIPLYHALQAKMITEFDIGVQVYLDQVRNAPIHKVDDLMSFKHLLPFVFQDIPKLVKQYSNTTSFVNVKYNGSRGFVDVCPQSGPNMVTTSRDGIWHSKTGFCKASCKCGSKTNKFTKNGFPSETNRRDNEYPTTSSMQNESCESDSDVRQTAKNDGNVDNNNRLSFQPCISKDESERSGNVPELPQNSLFKKSKLVNLSSSSHSTKESSLLSRYQSMINARHSSPPVSHNQSKSNLHSTSESSNRSSHTSSLS